MELFQGSASSAAPPPTSGQIGRFCTAMRGLEGERPETYVGSSEHLRDLDKLRAVAPTDLHASVTTYRDFIASGAVDPNVPESSLAENWPKPVQAAANAIQDYFHAHCDERAVD